MKTIDLNKVYPGNHEEQQYVNVSDEVEIFLQKDIAAEKAYRRKMRYHNMKYIEDLPIETDWSEPPYTSVVITQIENAECRKAIFSAFSSLTPMQARRAIAYFYDKQTTKEIALREGVSESTIKSSIRSARAKLIKALKALI